MSEPKTATEAMMLSSEENRLAIRDRAVAVSIASKAIAENFDPARIETMRDAERQAVRAAEQAAYEAIQKERELHAGDMAALEAWSKVRWAEHLLTPKPMIIPDPHPNKKDRPERR